MPDAERLPPVHPYLVIRLRPGFFIREPVQPGLPVALYETIVRRRARELMRQAAVVLSRNIVARPGTGVYHITPETLKDDGAFHGVVVTGETGHPTGVFRIKSGTITVTSSSVERISGSFQMQAEGFLAADMDNETRTVTVSGSFSATPSAPSAPLTLKQ